MKNKVMAKTSTGHVLKDEKCMIEICMDWVSAWALHNALYFYFCHFTIKKVPACS